MRYKRMGKSAMQVSQLTLGTMTFGDGADEAESRAIYNRARDAGINMFDTANVYARGQSESILGGLVNAHRDEVIIASKAYYPMSNDPNDRGLGRRHLTQSLHASLKRLKTDYLDVFYLHCFDPLTPIEEFMQTVGDFVKSGKVLHIGVSNFAAWQVVKAMETGRRLSSTSIHCIQPMYNILKRQAESELLPMAQYEDLGVFTYSPLAGGLLTGKYHENADSDGRFQTSEMYRDRYQGGDNAQKVGQFLEVAKVRGVDPVALAIALTATHPAVTAPLIGARTLAHLDRALGALDVEISDELKAEIENISPAPALATNRDEERTSA
jgi:aryl-alcohol dehydrogenase-like predicted oxidoreductase